MQHDGDQRRAPGSGLAIDTLATLTTRFGLAGLAVATDLVVARALGPEGKGAFTLVLLVTQLGALIVGLGLDRAFAVAVARSLDAARHAWANGLLWAAVVGSGAVVAGLVLYGVLTPEPADGPLAAVVPNLRDDQFVIGALALPFELAFTFALLSFLGRRRLLTYNALRIGRRVVLFVLLGMAALTVGLDLVSALAINAVSVLVLVVAMTLLAARQGVFGVRPHGGMLRDEIGFGLRYLPGTLAERLHFRADAFLLNVLIGLSATGVYSVATNLAEIAWYVPNALAVVLFSRAVDPEADHTDLANRMARGSIALALALALPVAILAPPLVGLLYGQAFGEAGIVLLLMLPGIVGYTAVTVLSQFLVARGVPGRATLAMVVGLAVNLAANALLIPALGIRGAGISASLSYLVTAVITLVVHLRLTGSSARDVVVLRRDDVSVLAARLRRLVRRAGRGDQGDDALLDASPAGAAAPVDPSIGRERPAER